VTTPPADEPATPRKQAAFSGFAKHWYDLHVKVNAKLSYQRSTERELRVHLVPFFGDMDLRSIDAELVDAYKAQKVRTPDNPGGNAPKTVNNHLTVLSSLFAKAVLWGYAETNPVKGVSKLKLPPREFRFWDREQSQVFLEHMRAREPRWYPMFLTALRTGLRQGELIALRWEDLDFVKRQLHVVQNFTAGALTTPKSGRGRIVPMFADLVRALKAHRHLRSSLVFCRDDGTYLSGNCLWKPMLRVTRAAGLPKIAFHDMRHSFASQLVMASVPLKAVQEYLGHADISTTMRYSHLSPSAKQSYVEVLDEAWSQNGPTGARERGNEESSS
jgi:integrase